MAYVGASSSWKYYVTADECLANLTRFEGLKVRVSGVVAPGTLHIAPQRNGARFSLQGTKGRLDVVYQGPLPDNLAESMEVVVEGRCETGGKIDGDKLLTRCASKYEPSSEDRSTSVPTASLTKEAR